MTTFVLGTHRPTWLADELLRRVPLMVSRNTLAAKRTGTITGRRSLPRAVGSWVLDSGGFTELKRFGRWTITPEQYIADVRRCRTEIGGLAWAAPMDWMCEPWVIRGRNQHLPVGHPDRFEGTRAARGVPDDGPDEDLNVATRKHITWTVANGLLLRTLAPDLPIALVVQGYTVAQYLWCVRLYRDLGLDLRREPIVGLGSVCRRENTGEIQEIVTALHAEGLGNLHGFGVKTAGLSRYAAYLRSADSQAWSRLGRHVRPGCSSTHASEANCQRYALAWYDSVLAVLARPQQLDLFGGAA